MKIAIDISPLYSASKYRGIGFYIKRLVKQLEPQAKQRNIELELVKQPKRLATVRADLVHIPYFSPFFLTLPKVKSKSIVTIHDLTTIKYLSQFNPGIKGVIR